MDIIEVSHITKDYGNNRGVFDVNFTVEKGQVLGFLGPNGAGKTTTIRQLMGFLKPDKGTLSIMGVNCWEQSNKIQSHIGYLPGEIAFMDDMTGMQFINFIAQMKKMKNLGRADELITRLSLNSKGKIKKMSKGMKQKIGIVCALMGEPEVLILDEPTSGLDPLMQNIFIELILEEKEKGTSILMSSHIFEEIEKTCDRAAIIKDGKIIALDEMSNLIQTKEKEYIIRFEHSTALKGFMKKYPNATLKNNKEVHIKLKGDINPFLKTLTEYPVKSLDISTQSLEEMFLHFYGGSMHNE